MLCCKRRGQSRHEIVEDQIRIGVFRRAGGGGGSMGRLDQGAEVQLRASFILLQRSQWKSPVS